MHESGSSAHEKGVVMKPIMVSHNPLFLKQYLTLYVKIIQGLAGFIGQ